MGPSEVASSPGRLGPWRPMDAKQREKHQGGREDLCPLAAEKTWGNCGKIRERRQIRQTFDGYSRKI